MNSDMTPSPFAVSGVWTFNDVQKLLFGAMSHPGGCRASVDLAVHAKLRPGLRGLEMGCGNGAGLVFLLKMRGAVQVTGIDISSHALASARERIQRLGLEDRCTLLQGSAAEMMLTSESVDFVWSEDCFCYAEDKSEFAREVSRTLRPGGTGAFTDWCLGPVRMSAEERARFSRFVSMPNLRPMQDYRWLSEFYGLTVRELSNTGRLKELLDFFVKAVTDERAFDILEAMDFNESAYAALCQEMLFLHRLACEEKLIQIRHIVYKPKHA